MALINVGVELARRGRRVLLVDFDLEAPGIETFNLAHPRANRSGIVDYVTEYMGSGHAPDVADYIYECPGIGDNHGRLWIMPAGDQDGSYGSRLEKIDWTKLYAEQDGYVLLEDLKAQWKELLEPDYVLIDSRTGHTEVSGICTRQLPDGVVVLFFPNEQNLIGLTKIVEDIKAEAKSPREKAIHLHYVMSNVPDLDDENSDLEKRLNKFQKALGYGALTGTIHHYNNMALLNQEVFTISHPRTRLTQEYVSLVDAIVRENPEDREGALKFLADVVSARARATPGRLTVPALENRLERIRESHEKDGTVLSKLGHVRGSQGRWEEALKLITGALDAGYRAPDAFVQRSEVYRRLGDSDSARQDLQKLLSLPDVDYFDVSWAVRSLRDIDENALSFLPTCKAFASLDFDGKYEVIRELMWSRRTLTVATTALKALMEDRQISVQQNNFTKNQLTLCYIGIGAFDAAIDLIAPMGSDHWRIPDAFNYAAAKWGKSGKPARDAFERVVQSHEAAPPKSPNANYAQCLAMAYWILGNSEKARQLVQTSRLKIATQPKGDFSCWSYLIVDNKGFLKDLDTMQKVFDGKSTASPIFIVENVNELEFAEN